MSPLSPDLWREPTRKGRRPGAARGERSHLGWDLEVPRGTAVVNPWPNARVRYQGWRGRQAVVIERGDGPVLLIGPLSPPTGDRYSRAPLGAVVGSAEPYAGGSELLHFELYRWGPPPSVAQRLALTWGELPSSLVTDWSELEALLGGAEAPAAPAAPAAPSTRGFGGGFAWVVAAVVVVVVLVVVVVVLARRRRTPAEIPSLEEAIAARGEEGLPTLSTLEEAELRKTYRRLVGAPAPPRASPAAMRATIARRTSRG